jgi:glycosyltransferase involved in cell wall biosynthesis
MRITIITSPFGCLPPTGIGAIEKRWFYLGQQFALAGHHVTFVCKEPTHPRPTDSAGVTYQYLRGSARTGSLLTDLLLDFVYSLRAIRGLMPCDVLVLNTFWTPFLLFLGRGKYRKSVYNVARHPKAQFWVFPYVDRLACVSHAVYDALLSRAPSLAQRAKVISNPINTEAFCPRSLPITTDPLSLCYTGRVHPEKGLDLLVQAYVLLRERHPGLTLTIVGPRSIEWGGGGPSYINQLQAIAGDAPINWVDAISDPSHLADQIRKCDIYCYPSIAEKGESFGVAPLEAMATGTPTVVSALECFTDFIEDGITGILFDHRATLPHKELANAIEHLIRDADLRCRLSAAGSDLAHSRFSTSAIASLYLKDFQSLLDC